MIAARRLTVAGICAATIVGAGVISQGRDQSGARQARARAGAAGARTPPRWRPDLPIGLSGESTLVMHVDRKSAYSHVGLVDIRDGGAYVIHVEPGETERESRIRREPLAVYLGPSRADAYGLFHIAPADTVRGNAAVAAALRYRASGISFDHRFDTESTDAMYCTELIWRAYAEAGLDLYDGALDRRSLFDRPMAWLSALSRSRHVSLAEAAGATR